MKLITRNTDYALRAICYLAQEKRVVTVTELVEILGVPRPFLRKILQQLSQAKTLRSFKGQSGGFELNRPPEKIFLAQVMSVFQGPLSQDSCFLKKQLCPNRGKCVLRQKINFIEKGALAQLAKINIASLIRG
jgi:Rrf2 family transcriptional regulator, cysteine metabolism repressor